MVDFSGQIIQERWSRLLQPSYRVLFTSTRLCWIFPLLGIEMWRRSETSLRWLLIRLRKLIQMLLPRSEHLFMAVLGRHRGAHELPSQQPRSEDHLQGISMTR